MSEHPPTVGVVLAGGLSRRMGGGDKALLTLGGRAVLEWVIERVRPQCAALVLSANGDPARLERFGLPLVADGVEGYPGPLAGVLAGLDWTAASHPGVEWVASVAADTPLVPRDLVAQLHAARARAGTSLACARSQGRTHPVEALWPVSIRDRLRCDLLAGEKRVGRWAAEQGVAPAEWEAPGQDPFLNLNTPEDLAEAERLVRPGTIAE